MMCASNGWRLEASPFTIMRLSRALRCAARSFRRIVLRALTVFRPPGAVAPCFCRQNSLYDYAIPNGYSLGWGAVRGESHTPNQLQVPQGVRERRASG